MHPVINENEKNPTKVSIPNTKKRDRRNKAGKGPSRWKAPRNKTAKNKIKATAKDEHTDWKKAHDGIKDNVVEKRKKEKRCTHCSMDNHTWRKCRRPILVAATFRIQK